MSVEITGPRAYEYQYTVTVLLTLMYLDTEQEEVFVENKGFEDAFLSYYFEENKYYIDLQVKERSEDITLEEFCGWLSHFQQRKTDVFLLKELQQQNHEIVFVTNNRCRDKVSFFLKNPKDRKKLKHEEIEELKEKILSSLYGKSGINTERYSVLKSFLENIKDNEFRKILNKIYLEENQSRDVVEEKIFKIMKHNHYIPEAECKDLLNQMLEIVRCGRDSGDNIVHDIKQIVAARSIKRILPEDEKYLVRESFEKFKEKLNDNHVLLLAGVPFSGKTYLAKAIAQNYLERGYIIKRAESLTKDDEAYNFLWSRENEPRLLLLEDPFGHIEVSENSLQEWDQLNRLINECISKNRKLIVTSRNDIVFEVRRKGEIERCSIQNHNWEIVDMNNIGEAKIIWENYYGQASDSQNIFQELHQFMVEHRMKPFLEIGEIAHLYANISDASSLKEMGIERIIEYASVSAEEICSRIERYGDEYKKIFMLLGGLCNTIKTITMQDFLYILYGENLKPSIRKNEETYVTVTIGKAIDDVQKFPTYTESYALVNPEKNILRELCKKGYIYRERMTNELSFKHPLYHYASILLLKKEIEEDWETEIWINYFEKAIGSLSCNSAICALKTLADNFYLNEKVLECFACGSNSIFPAVRDYAVLFLDKHFDDLDEKMQHEFIYNIKRNKVAEEHLNWNKDECWYQLSNSHYYDFSMMWEFMGIDDENISIIEKKILSKEYISKQETYKILCSSCASKLSLEFLEEALLREEAVIRSKAMYYIFSVYGEEAGDFEGKYLKRFENYTVVYGILKGAFENWDNFSNENKRIIIDYVKSELQRKTVAIIVKDFMEKFGDEDEYEYISWDGCSSENKKELWKAWAELFAQWLNCFPVKFISAHEPHMVNTTGRSLEYLSNEPEIIIVADAWINWVKEYMKCHNANDYGMSVMEYLIEGTADKPSLRGGMIEKILEEKDTNIITSHFSNLISSWEMLCNEEKDLLCTFLSEKKRIDYKWLQAICLVQKNVPEEVQIAVCGKNVLDQEAATIVEDLLQMEILEECLSIYCGFPQPLWWNGYHHRAVAKWDKIITEVLKNGNMDQSYYISMREFVEALYNHKTDRFRKEYCLYEQILKSEKARKMVFERLVYCVTVNNDNKEMWDVLLKASTEEEKTRYFGIINEYVELFEYKNIGHAGLLKEFDMKDIRKYILPNFEKDNTIIKFCEWVMYICQNKCFVKEINISYEHGNSIEVEVKQKLKEVIIKFYQDGEIHLLFTGKCVEFAMRKLNVEFPEFEPILEEHKKDFWNRHDMVKKRFEENCPLDIVDFYPLKNWCHTEKCM